MSSRTGRRLLPQWRVLLSGCGGGVTFDESASIHHPLSSSFRISVEELITLMRDLYQRAEDAGRHNTLDKIRSECLYKGIPTRDHILLTTGRISSEMVKKATGMEVPLIASRTFPPNLAIRLAEAWG